MNWEKSCNIPDLSNNRESTVILYSTKTRANPIAFREMLTLEELTYSERLRDEGQRRTWLSCRTTLRLILGSYLRKKPREIEFKIGRFGKLYLPGDNLFFNVSHSNDAFLLGFCFGGKIGVDIEMLKGSEDLPSMVDYAFSEDEALFCSYGKNHERFTEIWTLKEAFLKAAGVGLVNRLTSVTVSGNVKNDILRHQLNHKTFLCPHGETGSLVYRNNNLLKFTWLT